MTQMCWLCTWVIHLVENIAGSENFCWPQTYLESFEASLCVRIFFSLLQNGNINCFSEIALVIGVYLYEHLRFRIRSWTLQYGKYLRNWDRLVSSDLSLSPDRNRQQIPPGSLIEQVQRDSLLLVRCSDSTFWIMTRSKTYILHGARKIVLTNLFAGQ